MSRGLGAMQREILASLVEAKQLPLSYNGAREWKGETWIRSRGVEAKLPANVYDLRASAKLLARRHGQRFLEGPFQASFSRAANGLVARGLLERVSIVPLADWYPQDSKVVQHLSDGAYLVYWSARLRFVVKTQSVITLNGEQEATRDAE